MKKLDFTDMSKCLEVYRSYLKKKPSTKEEIDKFPIERLNFNFVADYGSITCVTDADWYVFVKSEEERLNRSDLDYELLLDGFSWDKFGDFVHKTKDFLSVRDRAVVADTIYSTMLGSIDGLTVDEITEIIDDEDVIRESQHREGMVNIPDSLTVYQTVLRTEKELGLLWDTDWYESMYRMRAYNKEVSAYDIVQLDIKREDVLLMDLYDNTIKNKKVLIKKSALNNTKHRIELRDRLVD